MKREKRDLDVGDGDGDVEGGAPDVPVGLPQDAAAAPPLPSDDDEEEDEDGAAAAAGGGGGAAALEEGSGHDDGSAVTVRAMSNAEVFFELDRALQGDQSWFRVTRGVQRKEVEKLRDSIAKINPDLAKPEKLSEFSALKSNLEKWSSKTDPHEALDLSLIHI